MTRSTLITVVAAMLIAATLTACGGDEATSITVYSGRSEELVQPLIDRFETETGITVDVRYAGSTELAATLLEEGERSPADVFFAQDPASLGAVADLFIELPASVVDAVPDRFSDVDRKWVGVSGRARVAVVGAGVDAPADVDALTSEEWRGRVAIAPSNGSFLSFVAAMILIDGEDATADWLERLAANDPLRFDGNSSIVEAVDRGEVDLGLVNHYYLLRRTEELGTVSASNVFFGNGGAESLVMPAGVGVLSTTDDREAALRFVEFLLSEESQRYFATETFEYPLRGGVEADDRLPLIDSIDAPTISLSDLAAALDRATELVSDAGLL